MTHTPETTEIRVETERRDGTAGVVVSDTGSGISRRTGARVFDRFYTGDSVSGSGLGVAIARELALRMDGALEVSSGRGRTEARLELPATKAAAEARGGMG